MLLASAAHSQTCALPAPPSVVIDDGKRLLQFWDVDDGPVWTSGLMPDSAEYWRFVRFVRARLDVSEPSRYLRAAADEGTPDGHNNALALSGKIGRLEPVNCLEALLLGVQAKRRPMETHPTEFLAFVLRKADAAGKTRLRVWYYTVDQAGIGGVGVLADKVEGDVAAGWRPHLNLHNHNFFFDKDPAVAAMPWPSANDVQLMKGLTLGGRAFEGYCVTNGFVTSHLRPDELKLLRGPGEK
jgi:hypothetical protein